MLANVFRLAAFCLIAGPLSAVPVIGPPVNQGSFQPPSTPGYGIAQGSMFALFGTEMGPTNLVVAASFPLTADLAGTSVEVAVGGQTLNCFLVFTSAGQLAAILPSSTPLGDGEITVTYNGQTSEPQPIRVVPNGVGMFTIPQNGQGPAVLTDPDFNVNTYLNSVAPGDIGIAWVTGLGARSADDRAVPEDLKEVHGVEVFVGGVSARVLYAGPSGCCAGVDQIVFEFPGGGAGGTAQSADAADPSNIRTGCHVPVAVKAGGVIGNFTSASVSTEGPVCGDPHAFPQEDVQLMHDQGALSLLSVRTARVRSSDRVALDDAAAAPVRAEPGPAQGQAPPPQLLERTSTTTRPAAYFRTGPPSDCSCFLRALDRRREEIVEQFAFGDETVLRLSANGIDLFNGPANGFLSHPVAPLEPGFPPVTRLDFLLNHPDRSPFSGSYDFPQDPILDFAEQLDRLDMLIDQLERIDDLEDYVNELKDDLKDSPGAQLTMSELFYLVNEAGQLELLDLFCAGTFVDRPSLDFLQEALRTSKLLGVDAVALLGLLHDHLENDLREEAMPAIVAQDQPGLDRVFLDIQDAAFRSYSIPAEPTVSYTAALSGPSGAADCNINVNNLGVAAGCGHNLANATGFGIWRRGSDEPLAAGALQGGNQFSAALGLSDWTIGATAPTGVPALAAAGEIEIRIFSDSASIGGGLVPAP